MDKQVIEEAKRRLTTKVEREPKQSPGDFLSSGSTLLNLACTDSIAGTYPKGKYAFYVGDSMSGKTFLVLTGFAEACQNPEFKNYRLIHDDVEDGALMNIRKFFGVACAARVEPPRRRKGVAVYSETIEDFYFNVDDALEAGKPFIYVLDSMDALTSKSEDKKFNEAKTASRKGLKAKGQMTDSKAKWNSQGIRRLLKGLRRTGSILIVISQTRDNFDPMSFEKKTRAGGRSLRFYATTEIWTSTVKKLKKTVGGGPRQIGIVVKAKVKKSRLNGKEREVEVPIYHSYGVDDIGSCVDFLIQEKHWPVKKGKLKIKEWRFIGNRDQVIKKIEMDSLEKELRTIVADVWHELEEACKLKRKPRYG